MVTNAGAKKKLTREESKAATRQRLLDAGYRLLMEEGITSLSMNRVSKLAGIAQPSFYTHFANLTELIDELVLRLKDEFLYPIQKALIAIFSMPEREDKSVVLHRLYLMLLEAFIGNNFIMKQSLERHQPDSVFGQHIQSFYVDLKAEWLTFLTQNFSEDIADEEKVKFSMAIDCLFAMIETLVMGLIRNDYTDKETAINILTEFTIQHFGELIDNSYEYIRQSQGHA